MTHKQKHRFYLKKISEEISGKIPIKDNNDIFIECGVKHGTSAIILARALQCKGYLFDTWSRFKGMSEEDGSKGVRVKKRRADGIKELCKQALHNTGTDSLCTMIQGDVRKTIVDFFKKNKTPNIIFAHLDLDLYLPTKKSLEAIWPFLDHRGVIFVHDYNSKWKGIKTGIDEFIKSSNDIDLYIYKDTYACVLSKKQSINY